MLLTVPNNRLLTEPEPVWKISQSTKPEPLNRGKFIAVAVIGVVAAILVAVCYIRNKR